MKNKKGEGAKLDFVLGNYSSRDRVTPALKRSGRKCGAHYSFYSLASDGVCISHPLSRVGQVPKTCIFTLLVILE